MAGDIADDREPDAIGDELLAGNGGVQFKERCRRSDWRGRGPRRRRDVLLRRSDGGHRHRNLAACRGARNRGERSRSRPASRRAIHAGQRATPQAGALSGRPNTEPTGHPLGPSCERSSTNEGAEGGSIGRNLSGCNRALRRPRAPDPRGPYPGCMRCFAQSPSRAARSSRWRCERPPIVLDGAIRQRASSLLTFTGPYFGRASRRSATFAVCANAGGSLNTPSIAQQPALRSRLSCAR
jgi:hypothetical protein